MEREKIVTVVMKDGTKKVFPHQADGRYSKIVCYQGAFAIICDEYGDQTAIPAMDIKEIEVQGQHRTHLLYCVKGSG